VGKREDVPFTFGVSSLLRVQSAELRQSRRTICGSVPRSLSEADRGLKLTLRIGITPSAGMPLGEAHVSSWVGTLRLRRPWKPPRRSYDRYRHRKQNVAHTANPIVGPCYSFVICR
jgi:hypothetical protein